MIAERVILPRVISRLIRISLEDEEKAYRDDRYEVYMHRWHDPTLFNNKCAVCLAGAVMAMRLRAAAGYSFIPGDFGENRRQLLAIDQLRTGRVDEAAYTLEIPDRPRGFNRHITSYHASREAFREDMAKLADELEAAGY